MAVTQQPIESINPATGEVLGRYDEFTKADVDAVLTQSRRAFQEWRDTEFDERSELMRNAASYLRKNLHRLAGLITSEMGKPITESEAEIKKCAWNFDFYADHAAEFLADEPVETNARESFIAFEPLGPILAIMPWNFPFWQVIRFAAPALMAGNTAVLKHSSNVPQCALAVEEVFRKSGFPEGSFRTLLIPSSEAEAVIADERITAVTLTGSSAAGQKVASGAGKALKKVVLELGGSDAFIVLADADLDGAVEYAVRARYQNAGQSCIAAKRFIVVEEIAPQFERQFVEAVNRLSVGDPMDPNTRVGPLAREDLLSALDRQVRESERMGARVATGGQRLERAGFFYAPTVVTAVRPDMPVFCQETFGPVAAVVRARDAEEAIELANASEYGLGGNLWTSDTERAKKLARRIESGNVFINGMTASDPRLPFGGVKHSGYGRELSHFGIREFTNIQTIWIGPAKEEQPSAASE